MKKYNKKIQTLLLASFFINFTAFVYAETFRVSTLHTATINKDYEDAQVSLGINDSVCIFLPEDKTFIEAIELNMEIPETVASWMDSAACSVYENIKPTPKASQIDYSGTRKFVSTLPGKLSWTLRIPLVQQQSSKKNNYITVMDCIPNVSNNFLFVRLQPIMKGVPEETLNAIIPITIKTVLINKGIVNVNLKDANLPEPLPCTVYIDDNPANYSNSNKKVLLDVGIHNISVISQNYRNEFRTLRIDKAKITDLDIELKSNEPTLLIYAPDGTSVTLDDKEITNFGSEFIITEGEHKILFSIGSYEILRTISAIKGKTYTANFTVDLQLSEE